MTQARPIGNTCFLKPANFNPAPTRHKMVAKLDEIRAAQAAAGDSDLIAEHHPALFTAKSYAGRWQPMFENHRGDIKLVNSSRPIDAVRPKQSRFISIDIDVIQAREGVILHGGLFKNRSDSGVPTLFRKITFPVDAVKLTDVG